MNRQIESKGNDEALTPMMRQYSAIKAQYPDHLVFYRMGDFYEMFGDDAVKGAELLGITLTKRPHGRDGEIPLAGVPHHAAERYLARLAEAGQRVVVCEQMEDPKTAKGVVKRDVIEIITPGTVMLAGALDDTITPRIAAVHGPDQHGRFGIAMAEPTTGLFGVDAVGPDALIDILRNHQPREIVVSADSGDALAATLESRGGLTRWPAWRFEHEEAERQLRAHFNVTDLGGVGFDNGEPAARSVLIAAAGALLTYLKETKRAPLSHITRAVALRTGDTMALDESTAANLDVITRPGVDAPSLSTILDRCRTPMGRRLLRHWLLNPLIERAAIERRLDWVGTLTQDRSLLAGLAGELKGVFDLERFVGRLGTRRISPRDLAGLREALIRWPRILELAGIGPLIDRGEDPEADSTNPLRDELQKAIVDDPPLAASEGGVFKRGYSTELDSLYHGAADARAWIAGLQASLREQTGIGSVKIGYNKVFNYYIEVPRTHSARVPGDWIRKQTLVNAERFITPELKEKEEIVLRADERAAALEERLFEELQERLAADIATLGALAHALARLDVVVSFAQAALAHGYTRPALNTDRHLIIRGGRHPVLETLNPAGQFVPNDTVIRDDTGWLHILTGPNMAGKSTYLRQVGLIVIMAQAGCFVPAEEADIGIVDRVFTRVGADDDLTRNRSTFMVEMAETARILTGATPRSLILFDEVGRGTSTYDGVAIAWSIAEHLAQDPATCPRTLFATHYHELTALEERFNAIRNYQLAVREKDGHIAFIFRVKPGGCDDSFGIHVARMAGVPATVVSRAHEILSALESGTFDPLKRGIGARPKRAAAPTQQESLFNEKERATVSELSNLKTDTMTPIEALNKLDELAKRLRG
ncbi:MAG: DNA mismatch repair protein MutS [Candidatus Zixiibacteriota bacterium]